jgi:hypothetical protein
MTAAPLTGKLQMHSDKASTVSYSLLGGCGLCEWPHTGLKVGVHCRSPVVDGSLSNDEAWQHGRLLRVGNESYVIDRNPPTIEKVCRGALMLLQCDAGGHVLRISPVQRALASCKLLVNTLGDVLAA